MLGRVLLRSLLWSEIRVWRVIWARDVRLRWDGYGGGFYANMLLCLGRRGNGVGKHCVTITLLLPGHLKREATAYHHHLGCRP